MKTQLPKSRNWNTGWPWSLIVIGLLTAASFAVVAADVNPQAVTDATAVSQPQLPGIVAIIGAIIILARVAVKLTPTPKDDSWLSTVITWLKHVGLHIGCIILAATLLMVSGCARFGTTQQDLRYDATTGKLTGKITTRAAAYTLFSSRSDLAKWKATQSEKSQGAEVGNLSQQGGTNLSGTIGEGTRFLEALAKLMGK